VIANNINDYYMVQDLLVYIIIIAAVAKTIVALLKFVKPSKSKPRIVCGGCSGCADNKITNVSHLV
jgi:hypothetical protein